MKKKIHKLQIARFIVQIIFLIFFSGLFSLTFGELKQVYTAIINGNFNFIKMFPQLIEAVVIIPLTIIFGRFFCGWLCTFGAVNDFIYLISSKVFKIKFRIYPRVDAVLKYLKYVVLIFIIFVVWTGGGDFFEPLSPWNAFAQIGNAQALAAYAGGFFLLALIGIGAIFVERFFCRYLCPLGAVFSIASKLRIVKISKPREGCGKCRICTNNCSMGIQMYKSDKITSGECINCLKCIEVCPRKNTQVSVLNEDINPAFTSAVAITAFAGLYSISSVLGSIVNERNAAQAYISSNSSLASGANLPSGSGSSSSADGSQSSNTQSNPSTNDSSSAQTPNSSQSSKTNANTKANSNNSTSSSTSTSTPKAQQSKYKDGTYTGTGFGHRPGLEVAVTIKSGRIANVQIGSNNETPRFAMVPFSVIPQEIIQAQSPNVDAVSGATESSVGIMQAVQNALSQAMS